MNKKIVARIIILALLFGLAWFVQHRRQQQVSEPTTSSQNQPVPQHGNSGSGATQSGHSGTTGNHETTSIPKYAVEVLQYVRAYGEAPGGYVGGREFMNREKKLPAKGIDGKKIRYSEWDVHPKVQGQNRGAERLVTGSDHSAWYSSDHYKTFLKVD